MKRLLALHILVCIGVMAFCQQWLSTNYPRPILERIIPAPTSFAPIPPAKDDFWVKQLPEDMRQDYIKYAEKYVGKGWEPIPNNIFAEFKTNGNRTNYERKSFELRRQMTALVMAEIMEHNGRFMKDIRNGLHYLTTEIWWGIPAHYDLSYPTKEKQVVDLFNAETANLLAWTTYMLHDELEKEERGICDKIKKEINFRMLTPARTIKYSWKQSTNNWNPWICSNWLSCILFCEDKRKEQIDGICQILQCLDLFYDSYPDDGGCDEGIGYWDRAAASLYESLYILQLATNGQISMSKDKKLRKMASFVYNTYIGNNTFSTFADSRPKTTIHPNIAIPFGLYVSDSLLAGYAMKIAISKNFPKKPSILFNSSGNYPPLSRELLFLSQFQSIQDIHPKEPLTRDTWLDNLQVFNARSKEGSTEGLYVAAKGGHNGESHNHNDIGNFIIYNNAEPIIIDIGSGTYTAQTFSNRRYELFNCRSAYHNVPIINGYEQHAGRDYKATNVKYKNKEDQAVITLDIAQAYPTEACVSQWKRTIQLNRGKEVVITEDYHLSKYKQPSEIVLICCGDARLEGADIIINNGKNKGILHFDSNQLSPVIERITYQDNAIYNAWGKRTLYRIRLIIRSKALRGRIKYSISSI